MAAALSMLHGPVSAAEDKPTSKPSGPVVVAAEGDADMPRLGSGISREEYIRRRDEQIGMLRGEADARKLSYNARLRAIQQYERQLKLRPLANPTTWTPIGPAPISNGQTQTTSVAVSGRVTCIAIKPTNPNIVYVGTAQGGVYRTLDGGTNWTAIFDTAASLAIGSIAIAPSLPTTVYVGTGEPNNSADSFAGVGVYRITSAETTATLSGPFNLDGTSADVMTKMAVSKILVHPTNPDMIWVSTMNGVGGISGSLPATPRPLRGLYRSSNATSTCTFTKLTVATANGGDRRITDMVMEPGNPDHIVLNVGGNAAAGDGGLWNCTSATGAIACTQILQIGGFTQVRLAINKVATTVTVYAETAEAAATCAGGGDGRLRVSIDGGLTWPTILTAADGISGGQGFYDIPVAVDPTNASNVIIGGNAASGTNACQAILKSSVNGGTSFTDAGSGLHADSHAIEYAPSNASIVYTGNDGGIFKSVNGGASWTSLNNTQFNATQFQSVAVHPTDPSYSIGGTQDNGTNMYTTALTWNRVDFGDGGYSLIDQTAADTMTVTMYHTYYNSVGNCTTASALLGFGRTNSTTCASDANWSFKGFYCGAVDPTVHCDGTKDSFSGPSTADTAVLFYAPMALGPGTPNTVYYGTDRLYRSTNKGDTLTTVSQAPIAASVPLSAIGISPSNDNVRIVGLSNGTVWATTTGSSTLTQMTGAWPAKYISRAVIDPNNANTAYITISGFGDAVGAHVWKTTNLNAGTPTWAAAGGSGGTGIPDVPVDAFLVDPNNSNILYAGTDIGVYSSLDGGATWNPLGTGLPRVAVFDMAYHNSVTPSSRVLRIATHGRGMWELTAPTPVGLSHFEID